MYESAASKVVNLNSANFKKMVLDSDEMWFVEFYAPWCGHCQQLEPSWEKTAKMLKGAVKVGAVNVDQEQSLGQQFKVQGFPTLKFFGFNKKKDPEDYQGGRDAESMVNFASQKIAQGIKNRVKGKDSSSSSSSGSGGSQKSSGGSGSSSSGDEAVVTLDLTSFEALVLKSKDIWLVEFYAPWCGHCKSLEPEYEQAAKNLKGQVKLGKVDATVEQELAARFNVKGYPTVKVFDYGAEKSYKSAYDYPGERTASGITSFGAGLAEKADIEPDLFELHK